MKYSLDICFPEMKEIARIKFNAPTNKEAVNQASKVFEQWLYCVAHGLHGQEKYDGEIITYMWITRYLHGGKQEQTIRVQDLSDDPLKCEFD